MAPAKSPYVTRKRGVNHGEAVALQAVQVEGVVWIGDRKKSPISSFRETVDSIIGQSVPPAVCHETVARDTPRSFLGRHPEVACSILANYVYATNSNPFGGTPVTKRLFRFTG